MIKNLKIKKIDRKSYTIIIFKAVKSNIPLIDMLKNSLKFILKSCKYHLENSNNEVFIQIATIGEYSEKGEIYKKSEFKKDPSELEEYLDKVVLSEEIDQSEAIEFGLFNAFVDFENSIPNTNPCQVILLGNNPPREICESNLENEELGNYWKQKYGRHIYLKGEISKFINISVPIHAIYLKDWDRFDEINKEYEKEKRFMELKEQ